MGQFIDRQDQYDEDGHPVSSAKVEIYSDTTHPQGNDREALEVDFVGSSTVKRLNPTGDSFTNAPSNDQKIVPVDAKVVDGVINI